MALAAILAAAGPAAAGPAGSPAPIQGVRLLSAEAASGNLSGPERALDGDPKTEFSFEWANGGASLTIDLGRPCVVEGIRITNAQKDRMVWVSEVSVGADAGHLRDLLGRRINLPMWRPGDTTEIPLQPSVGRVARVRFAGGGTRGAISEVAFLGRENLPERHLLCWSGDLQRDYLSKLDYLSRDLGATDLWLDCVETAFPQSNHNSGFAAWTDARALEQLRARGLRYWLTEHEAFTAMVNDPADLRDDRRWETTLRRMRHVYARAKALGFRGLVYDAEDYDGVSQAARERYKDVADHVDAWCFADEFGLAGMYYHRGLQCGRVLKEVWDCPLLQLYEARLYAGKGDCRAGNYWWLKGFHDAGIEIWIATERTYGAGKGEVDDSDYPEWCRRWFVNLAEYLPKVHAGYPFAARVLPGFAPWITRVRKPNYLPKYLDEQLRLARGCALGYWIYNEGNAHAGDPREVLDREFCRKHGFAPEEYLEVLRKHPTSPTRR